MHQHTHTNGPWDEIVADKRTASALNEYEKRLQELTRQRDELLEALRWVLAVMPVLPKEARLIKGMADKYDTARRKAKSAIAKVEAEK